VRGQHHAPAYLYPWERPRTRFTGGWVGPRAGLNRCGKSRPYRHSIPGPSSPLPVAIPTELPGPSFSSTQVVTGRRFLYYIALKFEGKTCLFYIMTQCVPHSKHPPPPLYKTILLMLSKTNVAARFEIRAKPTNLMWVPRRISKS
jgi:hypothetical protein